jgi:hypothetical protein
MGDMGRYRGNRSYHLYKSHKGGNHQPEPDLFTLNPGITADNLILESGKLCSMNSINSMNPQQTNSMDNILNNVNDDSSDSDSPPTYDNILKLSDRIDEESMGRLKGLFANIISSQNGSRILQKCLKKTDMTILTQLLEEILPCLQKMLCNPFGQLFCQKLYAHLDDIDRKRFLTQIRNEVHVISKNKIGFKPMLFLIDQIDNIEDKQVFLDCIKEHVLEMCYVILKLILRICRLVELLIRLSLALRMSCFTISMKCC